MANFTKTAIKQAFLKLLIEIPLDKITVRDISEACGINRNTFYYHYQDIYQLTEEIFKEEMQKALKNLEGISNWQEGFLRSARFALENRRVIYHVYNSMSREEVENYLYHVVEQVMVVAVEVESEGMEVDPEDKSYIIDFYKYALVGMMVNWIGCGMREDPEEAVQHLGFLLEGNIKEALLRSAEHYRSKA